MTFKEMIAIFRSDDSRQLTPIRVEPVNRPLFQCDASGYGVPPSGGGAWENTVAGRTFNPPDEARTSPAEAGTPYPDVNDPARISGAAFFSPWGSQRRGPSVVILCRCAILGCLLSLAGCASQPAMVALQPVGPAPIKKTSSSNLGYLMVYSAWEDMALQYDDPDHHRDYTVISDKNQRLQRIRNQTGRYDSAPARVALAAGTYRVTAPSTGAIKVLIPVRIIAGRTTVVYLDGSAGPKDFPASGAKVVKLPDGQIVGWSSRPLGE